MDLNIERSTLHGEVEIPGSKSHTIRAVAIAALAGGQSILRAPLQSEDASAAVRAYGALGASIEIGEEEWRITGFAGRPTAPADVIDVANSGTTLRLALGAASLIADGAAVFTGDAQIRRRPCGPLAQSLNDLGASVQATRNNGCAPFFVSGRLRGGETTIECKTSQYLSSLLINCPLADHDSIIHVPLLNEAPYVEMTLDWLARQNIRLEHDGLAEFRISGGQGYQAFDTRIPADFSTATFFLAAGALSGNAVTCMGLDMNDTQGDKAVVDYLRQMGAKIDIGDSRITVRADDLKGCDIDLNATPDALPMMAVMGCFARGTTRLLNVPQARMKETDRIAVMHGELAKLGAQVEELPDGLVIHESALHASSDLDSHDDHRIVMALAIAATQVNGVSTIHAAEAASVTFPGFVDALKRVGGKVRSSAE